MRLRKPECVEKRTKKKQASVNLHNLLDFYHFQKKTANTNARTRFEGKKMTLRASRTEHEKSEHIYIGFINIYFDYLVVVCFIFVTLLVWSVPSENGLHIACACT